MSTQKQEQKSGSDSTNIQAGGDVNFGLSYGDLRQAVMDIFKANFYELSEAAKQLAMKRAEEITKSFLEEFLEKHAQHTTKLQEPGVQASLFEVQKAYAKTGDKELGQRLLAVMLQRVCSKERSIRQIVLDEAIEVLPKLTDAEVKLLTLSVSATKIKYTDINSPRNFENFIKNALLKFFPDSITPAESSHLQYCGCFTLPMGMSKMYMSLGEYLGHRYRGLLTHGFTEEEFKVASDGRELDSLGDFVIKSLRDEHCYQFNAMFDAEFDNKLAKHSLGTTATSLKNLWMRKAMTKEEVEALLIEMDPRMKMLIYAWNRTILSAMELTPVGYAIAAANFNHVMNGDIDFLTLTSMP
ncbi:hypothetical protein HGH93_14410 [Chitinophaga polysaccharea]|uniref:LPO_1073/Vpar_1526 family protein n=1 Tax=Chitinophaga TaxID=79328 RepID=UPI001454EE61|nr:MULTISPECIES: LPO_1073/Vpar_1526 family protein [Chitinophaga]NLR59306.1 hypothetical protein [Chitinophaga polysaccharea]NLU91926.1 hypothetical protein [Chitinophaga sp. Ak27]